MPPEQIPPEDDSRTTNFGAAIRIGKYRVLKVLGAGAFGEVHLALDEVLNRKVAIKTPKASRLVDAEDVSMYLEEARKLARLNHPSIVRVYDFGASETHRCYIACEYIEGQDLKSLLQMGAVGFERSAELMATLAEALHHAHQQRIYHRDVKPANILIDRAGKPILVDFGLAMKDEDYGRGPGGAGTPVYMSPEQADGQGHRVDGRSDIFSLGAVFYELLTGRRPFRGGSLTDVLNEIRSRDPTPPRQLNDRIPRELERMCLKALEKRSGERYATAEDFAGDLRAYLRSTVSRLPLAENPSAFAARVEAPASEVRSSPPEQPAAVAPKDLRSFNENDADVFLALLPGVPDRDGLPGNLGAWKRGIETTDAESGFRVCLLYGPSGCGKSSLMKAGLLPRLDRRVTPIYLEATPDSTENRILARVRERVPGVPDHLSLAETFAHVRRGRGEPEIKVLVVIDQFEQWLFANRVDERAELVRALRECDGKRLQAIVMIRDDFWMASSRFMHLIEENLVQDRSLWRVDLFEPGHARKVLTAFGRGLGRFASPELSDEEEAFLDESIRQLAVKEMIAPVRLALFTQMVKRKAWVSGTLDRLKGIQGIGVTFLEETFRGAGANPNHRAHWKAAAAVLRALVLKAIASSQRAPGAEGAGDGVDSDQGSGRSGPAIKGRMRSLDELRRASGYAERPAAFDELIRILDIELKLITPVDTEEESLPDESCGAGILPASSGASCGAGILPASSGASCGAGILPASSVAGFEGSNLPASSGARPDDRKAGYYQLTHDYLVPAILEWIRLIQGESPRGRAELLLEERSEVWSVKPLNRNLPTLTEFTSIARRIPKSEMNEPQRGMMRQASRMHGGRALLVAACLACLVGAGLFARRRFAEENDRTVASELVAQVLKVETAKLPEVIGRIRPRHRRWTDLELRRIIAGDADAETKLHARLALLPADDSQARELETSLVRASAADLPVLRQALEKHAREIAPRLWSILKDAKPDDPRILPAAGALADFDAGGEAWPRIAGPAARALLKVNTIHLGAWMENLRPVGGALTTELVKIFGDPATDAGERKLAANILADYAQNDPQALAELVMTSGPETYARFFSLLERKADRASPILERELDKKPVSASVQDQPITPEEVKDQLAERQARAAIALARLGRVEKLWPLLKHSADPRLRSFIVNWLRPLGADPKTLVQAIDQKAVSVGEAPAPADRMEQILFAPDTSVKRALILALGTYGLTGLSDAERAPLIARFLELYKNDPDAGLHGALWWTLRKWGKANDVAAADRELSGMRDLGGRRWFVNRQGLTFSIIEIQDKFLMGSPKSELDRDSDENQREVKIPRRFAIAAREVTLDDWAEFAKTHRDLAYTDADSVGKWSPDKGGPIFGVSWFMAALYCNWLSEREGLEKCYEHQDGGKFDEGWTIPANALTRKGYRLPTEPEWESACRSGARTSRYYGNARSLLGEYAWYTENSNDVAHPNGYAHATGSLQPNDLGLFDALGNVFEWIHAGLETTATEDTISTIEHINTNPRPLRGGSFYNRAAFVRSALRNVSTPASRGFNYGFRPSRTYD